MPLGTMVTTLALLSLLMTTIRAQCFTPNGTDSNKLLGGDSYQPCYSQVGGSKRASMCCATHRAVPNVCRSDGLCLGSDGQTVYRGSCTDPTWRSPSCVKLCAGFISKDVPGGDEVVTVCPAEGDGPSTYCCGSLSVGGDCCRKKQGLYLLPDGTTSIENPSGNGNRNSGGVAGSTLGNYSGSDRNKHRTAIIAGTLVGTIILVSILTIIAYITYKRRQRDRYNDQRAQFPPEMCGPVRKNSLTPTSTLSGTSFTERLTQHHKHASCDHFGSYDSKYSSNNTSAFETYPVSNMIKVPARSQGHISSQYSSHTHRLQPLAEHEPDTDHVHHMLGLGRSHSHLEEKTPRIEVTEVPRSMPTYSTHQSAEAQSLKAGLGTREYPVEIEMPIVRAGSPARSDVSGSLTSLKKTLDRIGIEGRRRSGLLSPTSPGFGAGWHKRRSVISGGSVQSRGRINSGGRSSRASRRPKLMLDKPVPAPPLPPPSSRPGVMRWVQEVDERWLRRYEMS